MTALDHHTLEVLDWPAVLQALSERTHTPMGSAAALVLDVLPSSEAIRALFDLVDEVGALDAEGEHIPVGGVGDVRELLKRAGRAEVLDHRELREVGATLTGLRTLCWGLVRQEEEAPGLARMAEGIVVDDPLADELELAFEPSGRLSARQYPQLGELRRRVTELHSAIRNTLDTLVKGDELADVLQDRYVTQRNNRYVLPIKAHAKRWDIGIVHGTSGSGATAYIEPKEVVELNNRLRIAEGELEAEERRILIALSRQLGHHAEVLLDALRITTDIDLVVARRRLADALGATRPTVSDAGVVQLIGARHPVLQLRGVAVVGNHLQLGEEQPALVLSGPNAGGKTVALKTIALCALMVRVGCFVPAEEGSRVDRFETVLAAIGDAQTVHADLSSFSGHLLQLREMLERAGPSSLLLLDELASGTDPSQGSALAQALLEAALTKGPRVVVTTHFARLKALPASDARFAAAAVEHVDGRPTYRVVMGAMGESHALSIAERMGLPGPLLERATELIDRGERDLTRALEALDSQRQETRGSQRSLDEERAELAALRERLDRREAQLRTRSKQLEEQAAEAFRSRLGKAERAISQVVAKLQDDPSHAHVGAARATLKGLGALAPADAEPAPAPPPALVVGDRVRIEGSGAVGEVLSLGNRVQVRSGALTVQVPAYRLTRLAPLAPSVQPRRKSKKDKKDKRRGTASTPKAGRVAPIDDAMRTLANTLDLRGKRVDEALEEADAFLASSLMAGRDHVFLLHGHGTGAMKSAVRNWLRGVGHVRRHAAANADQGGDAYTIAELD